MTTSLQVKYTSHLVTFIPMPYSPGWHDIRKKPSGKWEARWSDETGTSRGKTFLTKELAKKFAFDRALEVQRGAVGQGPKIKTIEHAMEMWLAGFTNPKTIELCEYQMEKFQTNFPNVKHVHEITRDVLNQYLQLLAKTSKPGGQRFALTVIKNFLRYCLTQKWIMENPFANWKLPVSIYKPRALNVEELKALLTPDPARKNDVYLCDFLRLMYLTALRSSQIFELTPGHFKEPDLLFVKGIKRQPSEYKQLHNEAVDIVKRLSKNKDSKERLFNMFANVMNVRNATSRKAKSLGLGNVRPHFMKHSRVSDLFAAGLSPSDVSLIANTTKKTLVETYLQSDKERAMRLLKQLPGTPVGQTYSRPIKSQNSAKMGRMDTNSASNTNGENVL